MTAVAVDTSVAVKWLFDQNGSAIARGLLHDACLYAPDFLLAEMATTLWSKQRR
jgi:predicted nucleic acid-binding protein